MHSLCRIIMILMICFPSFSFSGDMSGKQDQSIKFIELKNGAKYSLLILNPALVKLGPLLGLQRVIDVLDAEPRGFEKLTLAIHEIMARFELVEKARNPNYQFWGDFGERLKEQGFLDKSGQLYPVYRDVILSAAVGDNNLELQIRSPIKNENDIGLRNTLLDFKLREFVGQCRKTLGRFLRGRS